MKRRIVAFIISLCMAVSLLPPAGAADEARSGVTGGIYWNLTTDGTLYIRSLGSPVEMPDNPPWSSHKDEITSVVIRDNVTTVGVAAFSGCANLTSVTIPGSVTDIRQEAFQNCTGLTGITIPSGVLSMEANVFYNCISLTRIELPDSLEEIGGRAFRSCASLAAVAIPAGVTRIGVLPFLNCTSLTEINVASGNRNYVSENGVLYNKDKTEIIQYPAGSTAESFEIPASAELPATSGGVYNVFAGAQNLTSITVEEGNSQYKSIDGVLYDAEGKRLLVHPAGRQGDYVVPQSVESVSPGAFDGCSNLKIIVTEAQKDLFPTSLIAGFGNTVEVGSFVDATGVALNTGNLSLEVGKSGELTAAVTPDGATDKTLTWKSDNTAAATVQADGNTATVTGVAAGEANITVTASGGQTASCKVIVSGVPVQGISLDETQKTGLKKDDTFTLTATISPGNATVKNIWWDVSGDAIVELGGAVRRKDGRFLTEAEEDGDTASASITVKITGEGTATVTATAADGGWRAACVVSVPATEVEGVSIADGGEELILEIGGKNSENLTATVTPGDATDKSLTWTSSNTGVATVSKLNEAMAAVTAVNPGKSTISVSSADGKHTAFRQVTVRSAVEGVSLNKSATTIVKSLDAGADDHEVLIATVTPAGAGQSVAWESDKPEVAEVDENGKVTAHAAGKAVITATSKTSPGYKASCIVTVEDEFVSVESITLSAATLDSLSPEGTRTATLTASITPSNATNKKVTWVSSNESVATVTAASTEAALTGEAQTVTVTAVGEGGTVIIATTEDGGKTASCVVNIPVTVKEVKLNKTSLELGIGQSERLAASFDPADPADKTLTWTSSNTAIATVDGDGTVHALKNGSATITATSANRKKAECALTVRATAVSRVKLDKAALELDLTDNTTGTLEAAVEPENATDKRVAWTSSDEGVATVEANSDGSATVTAHRDGTATITVTTTDRTYTANCAVTVKPTKITKIELPETLELDLGEGRTKNLAATVTPANPTGQTITWRSADESIATVAPAKTTQLDNGKAQVSVTAKKAGTVTILATTADGGLTASCTVTIPDTKVAGFSLDNAALTLELDGMDASSSQTLRAVIAPADTTYQSVAWKSSNENVAKVSLSSTTATAADGQEYLTASVEIIARNPGAAIITAASSDAEHSAACVVTVRRKVTGVELNTTATTITAGASEALSATVKPAEADQSVIWSSSHPEFATVDEKTGVIKALKAGETTITATAAGGSGYHADCLVTVKDPVYSVTSMSLSSPALRLETGKSATLTATVTPGNATDPAVAWKSTNEDVAAVSTAVKGATESGALTWTVTVTGKKAGTASIVATTADGGITDMASVYVPARVERVSLNKETLKLGIGQSDILTAILTPADPEVADIRWTSSDSGVATVGADGAVTAVAKGTATITATALDETTNGTVKAECAVTVEPTAVQRVKLSAAALTLNLTTTKTGALRAAVEPDDASVQTVAWASSDTGVVTVSPAESTSGGAVAVTAVAPGSALVTVKTTDGSFEAQCAVTVEPTRVDGLSLSATSLSIVPGAETSLTATITPAGAHNGKITWLSSDDSIVTVTPEETVATSDNGSLTAAVTVRAEKVGSARIVAATADGGCTATCAVTVPETAVTGLAIEDSGKALILEKSASGDGSVTGTIKATLAPRDATYSTVTWFSSDPAVASVSPANAEASLTDGTAEVAVTAGTPGAAVITAASADGRFTATRTVVVRDAATGITISANGAPVTEAGVKLTAGELAALSAAVSPGAADQGVAWESSNENTVTVDERGVVTAVAPGTAIITARSKTNTNVTESCTVKVEAVFIHIAGMTLDQQSVIIDKEGQSAELTAALDPTAVTDPTINWKSSDERVVTVGTGRTASVDENGKVKITLTARGAGTAAIIATTADGGITQSCTVTVPRAVEKVELNKKEELELGIGNSYNLTATVLPLDAAVTDVTWSVTPGDGTEEDAVTLSATKGRTVTVTAHKAGKAVVTVTSDGDAALSAKCEITVNATAVTGVTLDKTQLWLNLTDHTSDALIATVSPEGAANKAVTWESGDEAVAKVAGGVVTAVGPGATTVTVITGDGGSRATCAIVVASTPVQGVSAEGERSFDLALNAERELTAVLTPKEPTNKTVRWDSSNPEIVSVKAKNSEAGTEGKASIDVEADTDGNAEISIKAEKAGAATVTATTADGSYRVSWLVRVPEKEVTKVTLDKTSLILVTTSGDGSVTDTLTATVEPGDATDKTLSWYSSSPGVATVTGSADGKATVEAVAPGAATITAVSADGLQTASCSVTVRSPVEKVELNKTEVSLTVGDSQALIATVSPNTADQEIVWSSDHAAVAVTQQGVITAVSAGTATITAASASPSINEYATCRVTVTAVKVDVSSVAVSASGTASKIGDTLTLTAAVEPENATVKTVNWLSSNTGIATVEDKGDGTAIVTIKGEGKAAIVATTTDGGKTGKYDLDIPVTVKKVKLNKTSVEMGVKQTEPLTAAVIPGDADVNTIKWSSGNGDFATVDEDTGVVTAVAPGEAIITATVTDKTGGTATAECTVTVKKTAVERLTLDKSSLSLTMTAKTGALKATVEPENATDPTFIWTVDSSGVVSLSPTTGPETTVTALKPGAAAVTVSSGNYTAICSVTVAETKVEKLELNQHSLSLKLTGTEDEKSGSLTATLTPGDSTEKTVLWRSTDPTVAEVSDVTTAAGDGGGTTVTVTAKKAGTAAIIAISQDGGFSDVCAVTVEKTPVDSVTLDESEITLVLGVQSGDARMLTATVLPEDATDRSLTWESSNPDAASVTRAGEFTANVKAESVGRAVVTASSADGKKVAACTVTVRPAVTGVSLNKGTLALAVDESEALSATVAASGTVDQTVAWNSSDPSVATVENGVVKALKVGTASITATSVADGTHKGTCSVTVTAPVVSVTGVSLSPKTTTLNAVNDTVRLTATVTPDTAGNQTVTWQSTDEKVATVDANGLVTAQGSGDCAIVVTTKDGGFSASCSITVPFAVTGVTLSKTALKLDIGGTDVLTPIVTPANASYDTVGWKTSNASVVTVEDGRIEARSAGTANVTVTIGGMTATCAVEVLETAVTHVTLTPAVLPLEAIGKTATLTAAITPTGATRDTVTWTSSDSSVVEVTPSGSLIATVTGKKAGQATITVTADDTTSGAISATCVVTVAETRVTGVTVTPAEKELAVEETAVLTANVVPSDATNKDVTWISSDRSVAAVDADGKVAAVAPGTATITATTKDGGFTGSCVVTVPETKAASVTVTPATAELELNGTADSARSTTLTATVSPGNATNKNVIWFTSDEEVATVAPNGSSATVTGVKAGTATITAVSADGNAAGSASVAVREAVTGVTLNKTTLSLVEGGFETLVATVGPAGASQAVVWETSNGNVATVENGVVRAIGPGDAKITANARNTGYEAECAVTVTAKNVAVAGLSLSETSKSLTMNETFDLTATLVPNAPTNKKIIWKSTNPSVATVNLDSSEAGDGGKATVSVTAVEEGTAAIIATAADGGWSAMCTVTVPVTVKSVTINKRSVTLDVGGTDVLTATVSPLNAANTGVTWSIASGSGVVEFTGGTEAASVAIKALTDGEAKVIARSKENGDIQAECTVTVTPTGVDRVTLDHAQLELTNGTARTLTAAIFPTDARDNQLTWVSSAPGVVEISAEEGTFGEDGSVTMRAGEGGRASVTVTAKSGGTSLITVASEDGKRTATCYVSVPVPVESVSLNESTLALAVGGSATLQATVAPDSAANKSVTWSTSDGSVATVSGGIVTAVSAGAATITVKTGDGGFEQSCAVTVTRNDVTVSPSLVLTPVKNSGSISIDPPEASSSLTITEGGDLTIVETAAKRADRYTYTGPLKNGTITLRFQINGSDGVYDAIDEIRTVTVVSDPVMDVRVVTPTDHESLTASKTDGKLVLAGYVENKESVVYGTGASARYCIVPDLVTDLLPGLTAAVEDRRLVVRGPDGDVLKSYVIDDDGVVSLEGIELDSNVVFVGDAGTEGYKVTNVSAAGLDEATASIAKSVIEELQKNGESEENMTFEVALKITERETSRTDGVLLLDINPTYSIKDKEGNAVGDNDNIKLTELSNAIKITVQVNFQPKLIRHTHNNVTEYPNFTVEEKNGLWEVSWWQSTFSDVELLAEARSGAITFRLGDGVATTRTYTEADLGAALPEGSWTINGRTYSTLTEELLAAINEADGPVSATPAGTPSSPSVPSTPSGPSTPSASGKDIGRRGSGSSGSGSGSGAGDATVTAPPAPSTGFTDVPEGTYYTEAVAWAVENGVTNGLTETTFGPYESCNRAQTVTFLWRSAGSPEPEGRENPFTDVEEGRYYYKAVLWAVEQGITRGTTDATFSPYDTVTRSQVVTFLYRAKAEPETRVVTDFEDVVSGAYYENAVAWASGAGVTKGTTDATFTPGAPCIRAQIVTFLYRDHLNG